ncbi:MAG TPA: hypothetical protein VFM94_11775 [Solirubrobacterales bacterium]|nr:hypothetical protein [Solirubrobacterales bacterium]
MAVEISANGGFGECVSLTGDDAARFVDDIMEPSTDSRRLDHLERSDEAYERSFSPEPISELPASE